ncbi:MAG TPA: DnaA N-terminal domain-containing protein, partial [Vicinamibacteria bacterium]|nr:DnaA N-terminal domain-containing protein [Vicinamibacteria bacterium]
MPAAAGESSWDAAMPDARQIWQTALGELQLQMTRANFETWFTHSEGLTFDGKVLRVGLRSPFTQEALEMRFAPFIRRALAGVVGQPVEVRYEIAAAEAPVGGPLFESGRVRDEPELPPAPRSRVAAFQAR